jgi:transposase
LSTKIHALVDALGNPVNFLLTGGESHDLVGADHLLPSMQADTLIADKAFDAGERVIAPLAAAGKIAVIPPKAKRRLPRDYDRYICAARRLIENFFAKLKQFRAIATRYDKTARNFLAAGHSAPSRRVTQPTPRGRSARQPECPGCAKRSAGNQCWARNRSLSSSIHINADRNQPCQPNALARRGARHLISWDQPNARRMTMPPPILRLLLLIGLGFFLGLAFEKFHARTSQKRPGGVRSFPLLALAGAGGTLAFARLAKVNRKAG